MPAAEAFVPKAVDDAHHEVRRLAAEVARVARSHVSPEDFHAELLSRVVEAVGALGGAVWTAVEKGRLKLAQDLRLDPAELARDAEARDWLSQALAAALEAGRPRAIPPGASGDESRNPTGRLQFLIPLRTELGPVGVVQVVQRAEAALTAPKQLRFLVQMGRLAEEYHRARQLRRLAAREAFWLQLERFAEEIHARLSPAATAFTLANEGRRLIECDRASVAVVCGRGCRLAAVSGQAELDARSTVARLLQRLSAAAIRSGEPIWYAGGGGELPPQVDRVLHRCLDETAAKALGVLPLYPARREQHAREGRAEPRRPVGALVIERFDDAQLPPEMRRRAETVCRHAGGALGNALEHDGVFLLPLWKAVGRQGWAATVRGVPRLAVAGAAVAAVIAFLMLYPARLELQAKGTLQPVVQREIFAGVQGRVERVHVRHRDRVRGPDPGAGRPGTLLCELRNHELEEQIARIAGERATLEQQIAAKGRSLLEERPTVAERNRISAELTELKQRLKSIDREWDLCRQKQRELAVHSPTEGEVVTWDVQNLLRRRPVERGQRLMRIAETDGPWHLELDVPEHRIGHVVRAARASDAPPRVSFILATDPATRYEGRIDEIHGTAEVRGPTGNAVRVTVEIDPADLAHRIPGAGVTARIDCGPCSLGYDLLHDAIAWAQSTWFRL